MSNQPTRTEELPEEPAPRRRRGCGGLFFGFMLVMAGLWGGALGAFTWILNDAKTTISALEDFRPKVGSRVYSADGELLGEFSGDEHRQVVSLNEIPLHVQKAFLATEDHTFYEHKGVRPDAIVNAFVYMLQTGRTRGGSTISQQVVRNVEPLAVGQERTIKRKLREAIIAFQVEKDFTKDEILELYLNQSFLGVSAHGVQAAARQYFAKDCWDLSIAEGAMLAGLMRAPNPLQPFRKPIRKDGKVVGYDMSGANNRRNIVLSQMLDKGFITQQQYEIAKAESIEDSVVTPEERAGLAAQGRRVWAPNKFKAPYFVEEIRRYIQEQRERQEIFEGGLEIHTTIDMRLQRAAEEVLIQALEEFDKKKMDALKRRGAEKEFVPVAGALVCLDNRPGYRGYVRAMVGGSDFDKEKYNCATQARRQPGSSIKPFVWAVAMANSLTPSTIEIDEPYIRVDRWGNRWAPKNFSADFVGPVSLRVALEKSINIVSIKLTERLGPALVRSCLELSGIRTPIEKSAGLTIALGTPEVTVIDHCTAYSTFANLGRRYDPVMISEIKNRDGLTLHDSRSRGESVPVDAMRPNVAYVMTHLLEGVARWGTGSRAYSGLKRPCAGKTGTTNEARNVWYCGFTPYYTCVVWIGYRDNRPLGNGREYTGGRLACPIWTEFMIRAEEGLPIKEFEVPDGVVFYDVDRTSGHLGGSFREAFVEGTTPPTYYTPPPPPEVPIDEFNVQLLETL